MIRNYSNTIYILTTLLWGCFVFSSCNPSLYELKKIEKAKALQTDTLFVPLIDRSVDIELFRTYDQHKKADRWARQDSTINSHIRLAFQQEYDFSQVAFSSDVFVNRKHRVTFYKSDLLDEQERQQIFLRLLIDEHTQWLIDAQYSSLSRNGYKELVRRFNRELHNAMKP